LDEFYFYSVFKGYPPKVSQSPMNMSVITPKIGAIEMGLKNGK
jgi:hypothetical protein